MMKGRKLNAEGGIAGELHLNRPGYESGLKVYPKIDITEIGKTDLLELILVNEILLMVELACTKAIIGLLELKD